MPQNIITFLALQRLGVNAVPVAPVYGSFDLKYLANDSQAQSIFCMDSNFNYVSEILPETSLKRVIVTKMVVGFTKGHVIEKNVAQADAPSNSETS